MEISSEYFLYIDIAIAIVYLIFIIIGYCKGFLYEILSILYTIGSILLSWFLSPVFASLYPILNIDNLNKETELISKFFDISSLANSLIYFVLIFLVLKLIYILLTFIVKGINKLPVLGKFNKILGAFAGIINATIITIMISLLLSLPMIKNANEVKNGTVFKYISTYSDKFLDVLIENVDFDKLKKDYDEFDIEIVREQFKNWINSNNNE